MINIMILGMAIQYDILYLNCAIILSVLISLIIARLIKSSINYEKKRKKNSYFILFIHFYLL